ncbi:MAG: hypothetical protein IEMM0002_0062 [bacterium]|nr:MAG: hypothetical protein IEMM0002_0062 [bacterium]
MQYIKALISAAAVLCLLVPGCFNNYPDTPLSERPIWETEKLNIVLIETDDQRWDTLWAMPIVQREMEQKGVVFTNAFVTNPVCCPSRSSQLSGGFYSHNTNVLSNILPNGGAPLFKDEKTIATLLQQNGYKTALIGKYLNEYLELFIDESTPYIPPGWDYFAGFKGSENDWFNFDAAVGSSSYNAPTTGILEALTDTYLTDYEKDKALKFIDDNSGSPFFLMLSTQAPHPPATPAPGDEDLFPDYLYSDRGYDENDLDDKPRWVRKHQNSCKASPKLYSHCLDDRDAKIRKQLKSLQAVDRAVEAVIVKLEERGLLDKTVIIFTSDNGYLWGEHSLWQKGKPYEESIRVPFVIRIPTIGPGEVDKLAAMDIDLPATILELAGIENLNGDGSSLLSLILNTQSEWREELLLEHFEGHRWVPTWAAIRTKDWKYVEYVTGEKELYDLVNDPYELESRHDDPDYKTKKDYLAGKLAPLKGLAIKTDNLPDPYDNYNLPQGSVGEGYGFQLSAWGGTLPYNWEAYIDGDKCTEPLPDGLVLNSDGFITGTPATAGIWKPCIKALDSSVSLQHGGPQTYIKEFRIKISSPN